MDGPVRVRELGLDGDQVGDTEHHGGVFKAVYAFAQEDLDLWAARIGAPLGPAMFGENLTTAGLDVNEAVLGEQWRIGTALLTPVEVRIPARCSRAGSAGTTSTTPGGPSGSRRREGPAPTSGCSRRACCRPGDEIVVEHRPEHGFTVSMMFRALTTDPSLLAGLLDVPGLAERVYALARRRTAAQRV